MTPIQLVSPTQERRPTWRSWRRPFKRHASLRRRIALSGSCISLVGRSDTVDSSLHLLHDTVYCIALLLSHTIQYRAFQPPAYLHTYVTCSLEQSSVTSAPSSAAVWRHTSLGADFLDCTIVTVVPEKEVTLQLLDVFNHLCYLLESSLYMPKIPAVFTAL